MRPAGPAPDGNRPEGGDVRRGVNPDEPTAPGPGDPAAAPLPAPAMRVPPEAPIVAAVAAAESAAPDAPASPAPAPKGVRRHHWIVRVTHWVNTVLLLGMIASGLQIYEAFPRFGLRGTTFPGPNPFEGTTFPPWARLGGWLAGALHWHFFLMWLLALNGLVYVAYLVASGEIRFLAFRPRDVPRAVQMQLYYLRLRRDHPPQGKHNALQKAAYSFIVLLGGVAVASGLAVWKPAQLWWLTALFGGYEWARYWHFLAVWVFTGFLVVHVVLVFVVDPASLRAMITGRYRGRFPSHGA